MPIWARIFLVFGSLALLLAVAMGAFGAHLLKKTLTPEALTVYETAVHYHFYHALGLLAVGLLVLHLPATVLLRWAGVLMTVGLILFCGSLYGLSLSGMPWLGVMTPIGGLAFIMAWLLLAVAVWRTSPATLR
ncbi:MAG: DUF423 domain-containing protein [Candidatus Competibacteraceae bacterium]|nr:MAG: DUF423 domain-containing protein [Candidatus Competibacteraceae bacterium]